MQSIKAIKQRRGVVMNMKQAMKAMNLVATAKLRKSRERWSNTLPFLEGTDSIMLTAASNPKTADNIYVKQRDTRNITTGYIVFSSDRGKCGSYNINIGKAVINHANAYAKRAVLLPVGARGVEFFLSQSQNIYRQLGAMPENPTFEHANEIGCAVLKDFTINAKDEPTNQNRIDELYIAYTKFNSILNLEPTIEPVLPIGLRLNDDTTNNKLINQTNEMEYDPDVDGFLGYLAPLYLNVKIYGAMLESVLCEQAARMVATDTATNNAQELIEDLTLLFNRQRQGIITQEITEIVSGASALT